MVTDAMVEAGCKAHFVWYDGESTSLRQKELAQKQVRNILEAALSTDAEPVAWMWSDTSNGQGYDTKFSEYPPAPSPYISGEVTALYDRPQQPVPAVAVKALQAITNYRQHSRLYSEENAEAMERIARSALSAQVQDVENMLKAYRSSDARIAR